MFGRDGRETFQMDKPKYPQGRASALPSYGKHSERQDYELVEHLRAVRVQGDESMTAIEQYDPDFSLKLAACREQPEAEALLEEWLQRRVAVLERTRTELKRVWQETIASRADRKTT